jgi:hypothetical protein
MPFSLRTAHSATHQAGDVGREARGEPRATPSPRTLAACGGAGPQAAGGYMYMNVQVAIEAYMLPQL